jgi:superfamily II DNA or RNA helicase
MALTNSVLTLKFERGTLILETGSPDSLKELSQTIPLVYDSRALTWRCDPLYYSPLLDALPEAGYRLEDSVGRWREVVWPGPDLPEPRQEQQEALNKWMAAKRGVVVMPTGTGKTEVALAIMHELAVSTLVVAPVRDLMYQWHRRILEGLGFDAGIIGDNTYMVRHVSVITYDSACIHMEKLGHLFKLIVFDECHHLPGELRKEASLMCAAPYRLGLTATPLRSDGRHTDLDRLIGPKVYNLPLSSVKGKTLADYQTVRIPVHLSAEEQEIYNSCSRRVREYMSQKNKQEGVQFKWQDLMAEIASDPDARAVQKAYYAMRSIQERALEKFRVLEDIFRLHLGERVLVFTGSNVMARDISCRFLIPCLLSHCGKKERLDILDGFRDGDYPAIVANQVLDEGVDIPAAKVAVVLGGQASTRQATQRLGRILRKSGNKDGVLYEVICEDTSEVRRSRRRRSTDAYKGTRHRRI